MIFPRAAALLILVFGGSAACADSSAPFLWQVQGAKTTHYLLGSVHLLPEAASQLPKGIADAYKAADGLVFESDIAALTSQKSALALITAAKAPKGLKAELDDATWARLLNRVAALGLPPPLCEQYKAWFCALTLEVFAYQKAGFSGQYGLDRQLYDIAKTEHKDIAWFEAPDRHLALFTDMPETMGRQFLEAALTDDGATADDPAEMYRAWRDNDVARIETLVGEMKTMYPAVYGRLLAERNRNWALQLRQYLDGAESKLIIVGAAHWLGPDGLLKQLSAAGYRVSPYVATPAKSIAQPHAGAVTAAALGGALPRGR